MRFDDDSESSNVDDRRGGGGMPRGGTIGIGTAVLALAAWYFGIDPSIVINGSRALQQNSQQEQGSGRPVDASPEEQKSVHFVKVVLKDLEKTWQEQLPAQTGRAYVDPRLVLFRGATQTACGTGQTAMGPFYCPADQKVYIDLAFYDELQRRFHAPGDFAQAYVIAHEVGHHVQQLLGISGKVHQAQERASQAQANALSVRLELQADCFAGVWAYYANKERHALEPGDVDEAMAAAKAIGDDALQSAQGRVVPDSFTHGTSEQRKRWLQRGLESGSMAQCDTFKTRDL
ncbi:neutral zinc metallopeptidase [Uliginosibacterium sp. H3]|uniref:Neutral zinc metallopeptidase n=1 Tax=Uliginosibacterium silvisoli TaxID=3114758 RepID=A0ABU6K6R5_9RHOO|nr:neutral zinc metallopeptidase [Uliginosibacterium sp. H3]